MFLLSWWTVCSNYTVSPWTDPLTGLKQDSLTGEDYALSLSHSLDKPGHVVHHFHAFLDYGQIPSALQSAH